MDEQHRLVDEPTASFDERARQRRQELVPKIGVRADDLIAVDRVRAKQRTHEPPHPLGNVGALLPPSRLIVLANQGAELLAGFGLDGDEGWAGVCDSDGHDVVVAVLAPELV